MDLQRDPSLCIVLNVWDIIALEKEFAQSVPQELSG